jgi:hypothetical protein
MHRMNSPSNIGSKILKIGSPLRTWGEGNARIYAAEKVP